MAEFETLRGALAGNEPEGIQPEFKYQAILRVQSEDNLDFDEIERTLGLTATTARRRGERIGARGAPARGDLWMFRAPVAEERELGEHIDALWAALKPHAAYLRSLKERAAVDVYLGYASNIDHAGVTIPHRSLEIFSALELDFAPQYRGRRR